MSNYEKLKELAEATKDWDNLKSCWPEETEDGDLEVNWFVGAVTEDDDKYPVLEVNTAQYDAFEDAGRLARYYAAANPAAVLALIAENERLKTLRSVTERDLAQELEVWRHGPSCWNCGDTGDVHDMVGEWLGQCDCNAAKLIDISSERDQLRAEIAGLKTGYEAYERVNAELKAECARSTEREIHQLAEIEALRKERDARHPFKPFHEPAIGYTGCVICGAYTDHGGLPCPKTRASADAALGQGEQS